MDSPWGDTPWVGDPNVVVTYKDSPDGLSFDVELYDFTAHLSGRSALDLAFKLQSTVLDWIGGTALGMLGLGQ